MLAVAQHEERVSAILRPQRGPTQVLSLLAQVARGLQGVLCQLAEIAESTLLLQETDTWMEREKTAWRCWHAKSRAKPGRSTMRMA